MKALEQNVLSETLSIQDTIIAGDDAVQSLGAGDHFPESEGAEGQGSACRGRAVENVSWGFHSPLMFWNCSLSTVKADVDIIHTINSQARRRSYLNLTLRPTSVFAGKSFVKDKVVAADALVITIFNKVGKGENQHWDDRLSRLAEGVPSRWSMYPRDVYIAQGRLYEFQQKPMSLQDNVLLFISYLLMGVYFVVSLGKLRAVKSKLGLVVTVIFEVRSPTHHSYGRSNMGIDCDLNYRKFFNMRYAPDRPCAHPERSVSLRGVGHGPGEHVCASEQTNCWGHLDRGQQILTHGYQVSSH